MRISKYMTKVTVKNMTNTFGIGLEEFSSS